MCDPMAENFFQISNIHISDFRNFPHMIITFWESTYHWLIWVRTAVNKERDTWFYSSGVLVCVLVCVCLCMFEWCVCVCVWLSECLCVCVCECTSVDLLASDFCPAVASVAVELDWLEIDESTFLDLVTFLYTATYRQTLEDTQTDTHTP